MSDTGKYSNHPKDVALSGNVFRLKGMGLGDITAEAANHVLDERLQEPKKAADAMELKGEEKVSFLLQWMEKNPEPTDSELEDMVADYITTPRGLFRLTGWGLAEQLDITNEEAGDLLVDASANELFDASQVIFGGLLNKAKTGPNKTPKKKPRRKAKR